MLRHFVSNFQSLLRQQASQVAVPFSGHHPLLLLLFSLFRKRVPNLDNGSWL